MLYFTAISVLPLMAIAVWRDLRSREIPDWIPIVICLWAAVAMAAGWESVGWVSALVGALLGSGIGILMFVSGGFGGGDAKLLAALGFGLGAYGILVTLLAMGVAGGILAVVAGLRGHKSFAYGPAIGLGVLVHVLWAFRGAL